jgi:hypothetical protein
MNALQQGQSVICLAPLCSSDWGKVFRVIQVRDGYVQVCDPQWRSKSHCRAFWSWCWCFRDFQTFVSAGEVLYEAEPQGDLPRLESIS